MRMEQRQGEQQHVRRLPGPGGEEPGHGGEHVVVRDLGPLALPRGARGVEEHGKVAPFDERRLESRGVVRQVRQLLGQQHLAHLQAFQDGELGLLGDQEPGLGVRQHVGDLALAVGEVDGHHGRAEPDHRQVGDHEFRPVAQEKGHPVPLAHPPRGEARRQRVGAGEEVAVGEGVVLETQRRLLRRAAAGDGEEVVEVHGGMVSRRARLGLKPQAREYPPLQGGPSLPNPSLPSLHPPLPGREGLKTNQADFSLFSPGGWVEGWEKRAGVMRALLLALLLPAILHAQPPASEPTFSESLDVRETQVEVVVTGHDGRPVPGLTREDFKVREDGKPAEVTQVSAAASQPLMIAVFLDDLSLGGTARSNAIAGLRRFFASGLKPGDHVLLARWDGTLAVQGDPTGDAAALGAILDRLGASLPVRGSAQERVSIYALALPASGVASAGSVTRAGTDPEDAGRALRTLAASTGGRVTTDVQNPAAFLAGTERDLAGAYLLSYAPPAGSKSGSHKIEIRVRNGELAARYREERYDTDARTRDPLLQRSLAVLGGAAGGANPLRVELTVEEEIPEQDGRLRLTAIVSLPLAALTVQPQEHYHVARLTLAVAARDGRGKVSGIPHAEVPVEIPHERLLAAPGESAGYRFTLHLAPGESVVAVAARDDASGTVSVVRADHGGSGKGFAASPGEPGGEAEGTARLTTAVAVESAALLMSGQEGGDVPLNAR